MAHAILMGSTPTLAGTADPGDLSISLRFNSLIDVKRSRLLLIGADQRERGVPMAEGDRGDVVVAHAEVRPGPNVLRWQVLAIDGHITRGDVPFTVAPAGHDRGMAAAVR